MTEPEVSLYVALYFIKNGLTEEDIAVSIDGAHVKTNDTVHFDINRFFKEHGLIKTDEETEKWQGVYKADGYKGRIHISSVPGTGDIRIQSKNGKTIIVESKKGKNNKKGMEYPLMREAIGQLMTGGIIDDTIEAVVAVPYTEKSFALASKWVSLPQMKRVGIKFFLVEEDGSLCVVE